MEKAKEIGRNSTVDSKDIQQQSKAFDKLIDRVKILQLDPSCVPSAVASIAATKEEDDAKSMSESEGDDGINEELYWRAYKMDDLEDDLEFEEYARSIILNAAKRLTERNTKRRCLIGFKR